MPDWKIWYRDGSFYDSDPPGRWDKAPSDDVVCVTLRDLSVESAFTRWILEDQLFYFMWPAEQYPLGSQDVVPTLIRISRLTGWFTEADIPHPFPETIAEVKALLAQPEFRDAEPWVKFAAEDLLFSEYEPVKIAAAEDVDFTVGTSPSRRATDP